MLQTILEKRGLSIQDLTIPPKPEYYEIKNMKKAVQLYLNNVWKKVKVGVLFDVDGDGVFSGKLMTEYTKRFNINPSYTMNKMKIHGLNQSIIDWIDANAISLMIVVDAGTNDVAWHKVLSEKGISLIVLDHHDIESEATLSVELNNVAVVNCNYEGSPNRNLSGTGVVFKFLCEVNSIEKRGMLEQFEPWVGLSVISDSCSVSNKENRYYVYKLFEYREKIELFTKFKYFGNPLSHFAFSVIPAINSCIRTGNEQLAMDIALNNHPRILNNLIEESKACVIRQNEIIDSLFESCTIKVTRNVVLARMNEPNIYPTFTGLLANRLMDKHKKPTIVFFQHEENAYKGSFRGPNYRYKDFFNSLNIDARGHQMACGIYFRKDILLDSLTKIRDNIPNTYGNLTFDTEISDSMFNIHYQDIERLAYFNLITGIDLEPIRIKVKLTKPKYSRNTSGNGKRTELMFAYFEAVTFKEFVYRELDHVILTPTLENDKLRLYVN